MFVRLEPDPIFTVKNMIHRDLGRRPVHRYVCMWFMLASSVRAPDQTCGEISGTLDVGLDR